MTVAEYQNLTPREAANESSPRLFSFFRIRSGTSTRFYPGDGAKLHFANRDVDTLEMPGVPSGFLAAGDVVTALYRGTCVFRGDVATIVESRGRGTDSTQTVTCVGPWSKMQRLVYRQYWKTGSAANAYNYSSRLVLNESQAGAAQTLDAALAEIAGHAATACGYTVGTIGVSSQVLPYDECRDITVADAIKRELRFFPKAIVRFDYAPASGTTPVLTIEKNANATTASYVAGIPKAAREYVYNAHPITGVDLEIESTGTIEGVEYHQITHQRTGNTDAVNPDCLYATLQIKGASASATRQSFESVTEDIPSDLNDVSWWKERHPRLANVAAAAITITDGQRTQTKQNCVRISAATAGELTEAGLNCEVSKFTCKATIQTTDDKEEDVLLTMHFLTTNATGTAAEPKTYTWITGSSSESAETVPANLAATLLAERSGTLLSERLSIRLGDSLPCLGDAIVEAEGRVYLQSFDVDCGSLTADLDFGIPDYLAPEDMASLLSGFRNKCTSHSSSVRKSGKTEDGADKIKMGAIPPLSSSEFAPGKMAKMTISGSSSSSSASLASTSPSSSASSTGSVVFDTTGSSPSAVVQHGTKKISLDTSDIPDECDSGEIKVHKLKYNDSSGNVVEYHGLFCGDIDLTGIKSIKDATATAISGTPGGTQVVITYTDNTTTTFVIYNGLNGGAGTKGDDGDTPEITAEKNGDHTYIYADGTLIATINDGTAPEITASKSGTTTTIYVDGNPVAQIEDGAGGLSDFSTVTCISGIRFETSGGKLKAVLSKTTFHVPHTATMQSVTTADAETIDVCDAKEVDVVTSEAYSTSTHQFTNTRRRITVLADAAATGQTPFTATALTSE